MCDGTVNAIRRANEKDGGWSVVHSGVNIGNFVIKAKEKRKERFSGVQTYCMSWSSMVVCATHGTRGRGWVWGDSG